MQNQYGMDRQNQVYLAGLQGQRPSVPVSYADLEVQAKAHLTPEAYGYVAGGAGMEETMRTNREAFRRWHIVPRMLRDVSQRDLHVHILDQTFPVPVMLAPIGVQSIVHPDAEVATARAATEAGVPFILSTASSKTLEEVAQAAGSIPHWFQLYWGRDPELTASFLARAEHAGYSALVVTLDTNLLSWRERDIQHAYLPFLLGEGVANYFSDPVFRSRLQQPPEQDPQSALLHFVRVFTNPALTWNDLAFLRSHTHLPLILKGILHPDDALKAIEYGASGIIVSNHGGRQVDGAIAALDALPTIVQAVQGRVPVLFDSGIRSGADAFKALALGAQAVLLGRPYMWGLALGGQEGVREVLRNVLADFDLTLALSGYTSAEQVDRTALM
jgi:isopentenyl diphosphate isomerase/L-lactate dehydrogenase-like FMN-dependent dehydrogenase